MKAELEEEDLPDKSQEERDQILSFIIDTGFKLFIILRKS